MRKPRDYRAIADKLRELDPLIQRECFFATIEPGARKFALSNPYAFLMAACLDRGSPSKVIWTIPYWLRKRWGHLDPERVKLITENDLKKVLEALPRPPRFIHMAPATIIALSQIVADEFGGDARALWRNRSAADFRQTLQSIPGVGPGIANMAVQLVERVFPEELRSGGQAGLDIKPDTHTRRVLHRLGVAKEESDAAALAAARALYPERPGRLDGPLWYVGHTWCHAQGPNCEACFVKDVCARDGVGP